MATTEEDLNIPGHRLDFVQELLSEIDPEEFTEEIHKELQDKVWEYIELDDQGYLAGLEGTEIQRFKKAKELFKNDEERITNLAIEHSYNLFTTSNGLKINEIVTEKNPITLYNKGERVSYKYFKADDLIETIQKLDKENICQIDLCADGEGLSIGVSCGAVSFGLSTSGELSVSFLSELVDLMYIDMVLSGECEVVSVPCISHEGASRSVEVECPDSEKKTIDLEGTVKISSENMSLMLSQ